MKIELERIDTQEGMMVEVLLDSGAVGLVISSEFSRKQGFTKKLVLAVSDLDKKNENRS